jgi:uncharacterized protein DUF1616
MSWLLIPLVLFLPGYAIAALAFPPGSVGPAERSIYAVTLSIAVAAVGGLVLQLAIGLDRVSWAVLLAVVTLVCIVQGVRLGRYPKPRRPRLPWALPLVVVAFAAAGLVSAMAVVSAHDGLLDSRARAAFTDFWMVPAKAAATPDGSFVVGLRSHEREPSRYLLRLSHDGRLLHEGEVVLRPGRQRVWDFVAPAGPGPVVASVSQDGEPSRRLYLPLGG